jgi:catechol 2,3-dioxygenase
MATTTTLPAALRLGPVWLTVADAERAANWYESILGLRVQRRAPGEVELGDGREGVIVLREDPQAKRAGRHAGLYHYALLYPTREELARAATRLAQTGTRIQGMSDHGTHEAIYLADPDGNGIELAADRPRDRWPNLRDEFSQGGPKPLNIQSLLAIVAGQAPPDYVEDGLRIGHVHLHVGDVARGLTFYRDILGFEEQFEIASAAFVSAGGYHHHLAFNTWQGEGVHPAPSHTAGLERWTIQLPTEGDVAAVRDRVAAAGIASEPIDRGILIRDPWQIPVAIVH